MGSNLVIKDIDVTIKPENFRNFLLAGEVIKEEDELTPDQLLSEMDGVLGNFLIDYEIADDFTITTGEIDDPSHRGWSEDEFWEKTIKFTEKGSYVHFFDDSDHCGNEWYFSPERGRHTDEDLREEEESNTVNRETSNVLFVNQYGVPDWIESFNTAEAAEEYFLSSISSEADLSEEEEETVLDDGHYVMSSVGVFYLIHSRGEASL